MSKTIKKIFDSKLTFIKLLEAHQRSSKNKRNSKDVLTFEVDLESNISNLLKQIKSNQYRLGKYHEFIIIEPKKRVIKSLPYKDRIVHQWYIEEFIKPYILPRFINDSYACIEGKGTHQAVMQLGKYMRIMKRHYHDYYVLKCDIAKFFYSIDKSILLNILKRYIGDKKLFEFTKILLCDESDNIGIPIGNYTSQFFANIYLNELDYYVKDILKIKYYIRYMDDFVFLVQTKQDAQDILDKVKDFVENKLNVKLNKNSAFFPNQKGIDFCGYKVFETHILIRKRSIIKIKRLVNKWNTAYIMKSLDLHTALIRWNSFIAHVNHGNTYNLKRKIYNSLLFKSESIFKSTDY